MYFAVNTVLLFTVVYLLQKSENVTVCSADSSTEGKCKHERGIDLKCKERGRQRETHNPSIHTHTQSINNDA